MVQKTSLAIACGGFLAFMNSDFAFAQETAQVYNPNNKPIPKALPQAKLSPVQFGQLPSQLEAASESAFVRGLMPLESRLTYLALARDSRLAVEDLSVEQQAGIWAGYRDELVRVVSQIERLNQPGAAGWGGELAWSHYALARAEHQLAIVSGNQEATDATQGGVLVAAENLLQQREWDYSLGLASLADLAYSRDRFLDASNSGVDTRLNSLDETRMLLTGWNQRGAAIGRTDKILAANLTGDVLILQSSLESGQTDAVKQSISALHQAGHEHFAQTYAYYQRGTAPLHQLSSSVMLRQRLIPMEREFPELSSETDQQTFQQDWQALKTIASQTNDLRGRVQADVIAIDLMAVSINQSEKNPQ